MTNGPGRQWKGCAWKPLTALTFPGYLAMECQYFSRVLFYSLLVSDEIRKL